jgi:hypothetical protein
MIGSLRVRTIAILLLAASLLTACASDEDTPPPSEPQAVQEPPPAPSLLDLRDVRRQPPGSAERAVISLWYWAQWGSSPNVAVAYHPTVRSGVGIDNLVGTFSQQRQAMMTARPRLLNSVTTKLGTFVAVRVERSGGEPVPESYLLRRDPERGWEILHDTFFERALGSFVQFTTQANINLDAEEPSDEAVQQGQAAARRFRALFAPADDG